MRSLHYRITQISIYIQSIETFSNCNHHRNIKSTIVRATVTREKFVQRIINSHQCIIDPSRRIIIYKITPFPFFLRGKSVFFPSNITPEKITHARAYTNPSSLSFPEIYRKCVWHTTGVCALSAIFRATGIFVQNEREISSFFCLVYCCCCVYCSTKGVSAFRKSLYTCASLMESRELAFLFLSLICNQIPKRVVHIFLYICMWSLFLCVFGFSSSYIDTRDEHDMMQYFFFLFFLRFIVTIVISKFGYQFFLFFLRKISHQLPTHHRNVDTILFGQRAASLKRTRVDMRKPSKKRDRNHLLSSNPLCLRLLLLLFPTLIEYMQHIIYPLQQLFQW